MNAIFHLSLPCKNIEKTKYFYEEVLGTTLGRNTNTWIDVDLFGSQITFIQSGSFKFDYVNYKLGEQILPAFHFGIIINIDQFGKLYGRLLQLDIGTTIKTTFLENRVGEHLSFFVEDPNGYKIEFKCFKSNMDIFKVQK